MKFHYLKVDITSRKNPIEEVRAQTRTAAMVSGCLRDIICRKYQETVEEHGNEDPTNHHRQNTVVPSPQRRHQERMQHPKHSSMGSTKNKRLVRSRCKNGKQPFIQNNTNSKPKHEQATRKTTKTMPRELDLYIVGTVGEEKNRTTS
ncbi:hypothetical protein M0802_002191 [Mischocyttarus mexicanus]|nr:hypothetical protein M0802_002191 [Mischocyttarus mexicanus]